MAATNMSQRMKQIIKGSIANPEAADAVIDLMNKFNDLAVKIDADMAHVNAVLAKIDSEMTHVNAVLAKLDADAGVTDTDYASGNAVDTDYVSSNTVDVDYESTMDVDIDI